MSQLASFTELPVRAVQFLIPAALPRRRLFRRPEFKFNDYLQEHGKDLGCFGADGMGLISFDEAAAISYLQYGGSTSPHK